jgi:hypothetical protein
MLRIKPAPSKKKKVVKPYKNLGELYTEVVEGEPSIGRVATPYLTPETGRGWPGSDLSNANDKKNADEYQKSEVEKKERIEKINVFKINALFKDLTKWTPFQLYLFQHKVSTKGQGKGEFSIAAMMYRAIYEKELTSSEVDLKHLEQYIQGGKGASADVVVGEHIYEVKQTEGGSVQTGRHGVAYDILRIIIEDIINLHTAYSKLPDTIKNKHLTLRKILNSANEYFQESKDALPRGAISIDVNAKEGTPLLHLLPGLLAPIITPAKTAIVATEDSKFERSDLNTRLGFIADLYNLKLDKKADGTIDFSKNSEDLIKAKTIDLNARKISSNFPALPGSESEKEALEDFIHIAQESVFGNAEKFKAQIQDIFSDTPIKSQIATKKLRQIFPNTGLFIVSPQGYKYAGHDRLSELVMITEITQGKFKIAPINKPVAV